MVSYGYLCGVYCGIGRALDLDINVHGAPNFRAPRPQGFTSLSSPIHAFPTASSPSYSHPPTPTSTSNLNAGAPTNLNVYGCAQPRTQGLRAILSILRCRPRDDTGLSSSSRSSSSGRQDQGHVVWFCTREEPIGEVPLPPFIPSN